MSLSEIKNKLYKKEEDKDLSKHEESEFDPKIASLPQTVESSEDLWAQKQDGLEPEQKKTIKLGAYILGGVIAIILIGLSIYGIRVAAFSSDRVLVNVAGSSEAKSGKLISYEISYNNNNRASLNNAVIRVTFPESFKPEDNINFKQESPTSGVYSLGTVAGKAQSKVVFSGRIYSPKGALLYITADLIYNPSTISTQFQNENKLGVNVISTPIELEIMAPQNVATGDQVDYQISYKNVGEEDFDSVRIKIDYPEGFTFSDSQPKVSEGNNTWYVGHLSRGQEGKIVATGSLSGNKDEVKNVRVWLGTIENGAFVSYNDETTQTNIVSSPLAISQTVNGSNIYTANAGDSLRFVINYENQGTIGLRDVIVNELIDSPVLDYSTLEMDNGSFDQSKKTITWKASDFPQLSSLEPGKSGSISFTVKVKDVIPVSSDNDKNFVISSLAKIDSPDIPTPIHMNKIISGNKMDIKLNSKLFLAVSGFYNDSSLPNSGPIPPKVGQETTYTIHWKLTNVSNDVSGARIEAVLPTNATMTGKVYPEGSNITYNERTNSISWDIGNVKAGAGILSPAPEVAFQVKIKPSSDQVGKPVDLIKDATITAKDEFTRMDLSVTAPGKTTELREDSSIGAGYKVVN